VVRYVRERMRGRANSLMKQMAFPDYHRSQLSPDALLTTSGLLPNMGHTGIMHIAKASSRMVCSDLLISG